MVVLEKQVTMDKDIRLDKSDHMFIHYFRDNDIHDGATEASFEFNLEVIDRDKSAIVRKYKVKKCGVRMLYISPGSGRIYNKERTMYSVPLM